MQREATRPATAPKATDSTLYFDGMADLWPSLYTSKSVFRDRLDLFVRGVTDAVPEGGRVLDFGCGPGVMSLALAKMNYRVVGVDGCRT